MKNSTDHFKNMVQDNAVVPKYVLLAQELRHKIQRGELVPGQPLPPYLEIKQLYGISKSTVEKAYQTLEAEGLIWRKTGSGVYVSEPRTNCSTGLVGFVDASPNFNRHFEHYIQFVDGLRQQAAAQNQCLVLIDDPAPFSRWEQLDGLVLCEQWFTHTSPECSWEDIRHFIPKNLPVVNTFSRLPGMASVIVDEADGIRQLVEHFAKQGHRRVGYMGRMYQSPFINHSQVQSRFQAYQQAIQEFGLEADTDLVYSPPIEHYRDYPGYGYQGMKMWLENGWRDLECTALLAHNDRAATGMIDALREDGVKVPEEVCIGGYDGTELFRVAAYELTTVKVPVYDVGTSALKVLLSQMENTEKTPHIVLPVQLMPGIATDYSERPITMVA